MAAEKREDVRIVLTTTRRSDGPMIARHLVDKRLAACVNITDVRSYYCWENAFCEDEEALLVIKTTAGRCNDVMDAILQVHPYELPEIIVLPVVAGHPPYLEWIASGTGA